MFLADSRRYSILFYCCIQTRGQRVQHGSTEALKKFGRCVTIERYSYLLSGGRARGERAFSSELAETPRLVYHARSLAGSNVPYVFVRSPSRTPPRYSHFVCPSSLCVCTSRYSAWVPHARRRILSTRDRSLTEPMPSGGMPDGESSGRRRDYKHERE